MYMRMYLALSFEVGTKGTAVRGRFNSNSSTALDVSICRVGHSFSRDLELLGRQVKRLRFSWR